MTVLIMCSVNYNDNDVFFKEFSDFFLDIKAAFFNERCSQKDWLCLHGQF